MVNNLDLSTIVAQIPEAQKLNHVQQVHPETQQAMAQLLVQRRQRLEQKQVVRTEGTEQETGLDPEGGGQGGQEHGGPRHKRTPDKQDPDTDQEHLIDMQV